MPESLAITDRGVGSARWSPAGVSKDLLHPALVDFGRKEATDKAWGSFRGALSFAVPTDGALTALVEAVAAAEAD